MNILKLFKLGCLFFFLTVMISCSSSDSGHTATGKVTLLITDGVTDEFDEVNLTVRSVSFLGENDGHETIVFDESRVINLLALQNHSDLMVTAVIAAGTYDKIRLHVTKVELVKEGQTPIITKLPANGKVDLNPRGTFEVIPNGNQTIELDVDAEKSIHIVKKGNGDYSYNFRPVVFVNIIGVDQKLVLLDGKVVARSETGFQLCEVSDEEEVVHHDDACLDVLLTGDTVVQDDLIDIVSPKEVNDGDFVTVLGKASEKYINALHVVIEGHDKAVSNLALFTGDAISDFDVDHFMMDADDGDGVMVQPLSALTVAIVDGSGVRVYDKYGDVVDAGTIVVGTGIDVFGLAEPDVDNASKVKAAFVILDNEERADKVSGTIAAISQSESQVTVSVVNDSFSGDVCVDTKDAIIFILAMVDGKVVSKEISIINLEVGMRIDAYVQDTGLSCQLAEVVLVADPLAVTPVGATLLVTGN
jgi:hypothetical protein